MNIKKDNFLKKVLNFCNFFTIIFNKKKMKITENLRREKWVYQIKFLVHTVKRN